VRVRGSSSKEMSVDVLMGNANLMSSLLHFSLFLRFAICEFGAVK
jgi:hypothetical protein